MRERKSEGEWSIEPKREGEREIGARGESNPNKRDMGGKSSVLFL